MKIDLAASWFHGGQSAAGKDETPAPAADCGQRRDGVAGQFVRNLVADRAGELVKGDDAGMVPFQLRRRKRSTSRGAAADLSDQQITLNDRRTADTEEVLHKPKLGFRIVLPDRLP